MGELTDTRLRECVACWRCSKPVPDFEFAEALSMATELQELREFARGCKESQDGIVARMDELVAERDGLHRLLAEAGVEPTECGEHGWFDFSIHSEGCPDCLEASDE